MFRGGYLSEVDSLRALAVFAVMANHWLQEFAPFRVLGGYGVTLFFVISGYLITGILLRGRERNADGASTILDELRAFYARRFLRIFPVYYAVLFVAALVGLPWVVDYLGWHLLYASNILIARVGHWPEYISHLWSLAIEEQFYLIWPLLILSVPRRLLLPVMVATCLGAIAYRSAMAGAPPISYTILLPAKMDALAGGALLALAHERGRGEQLTWPLVIAALLMVFVTNWQPGPVFEPTDIFVPTLGVTIISAAAIQLVARYHGTAALAWMRVPPVLYLGRISYGIYLYHLFVAQAVKMLVAWRWIPEFGKYPTDLLNVGLTIAIASASWHLFEKPINDLKRFFPYERRGRPVPESAPSAVL